MTEQPWLWSLFPRAEMTCKCGCGRADMVPEFMDRLVRVRVRFARLMIVSSGFRCPKHNMAESSTGPKGPHTTGRAADISIRGGGALALAFMAYEEGMTGLGFKQHGATRFLHLDDIPASVDVPRPWVWSYP